ncbi:MAG: glutamine-hydrolyzing carbamoyl-phosphate synthase small subunit [Candidatus Margulisiibacteriota bacterium]
MKAILALEDGTIFAGRSFGAVGERCGEVVFNTSLTGYQEILTDPSYKGQIVCMTYPLIGNYGINEEDLESAIPHCEGFVVRENSQIASNFRSTGKLDDYLKKHGIIGIEGIDTRMLTRRLRLQGSLKGIISTTENDTQALVKKAKESSGVEGVDLVKVVTCKKPYVWNETSYANNEQLTTDNKQLKYHIVAYDFGIKFNILRNFQRLGCRITVVPATTPAAEVLAMNPDGIFLSNGPADPAAVTYAIENIKQLIGKKPIFGICLGHQLIGLAMGAKTYKLKFGHHGGNQPTMDLNTRKVDITSQNHGFAVDPKTFTKEMEVTHINLNDETVEGFRHTKLPIFSVQYHPEAGPGPRDANYLFEKFIGMINNAKTH